MSEAFPQMTWLLALAWFVVYWIVTGMIFGVVALTRFLKIKTAQFSCLFTLACAAAAYGAATTGLIVAEPKATRCIGAVSDHMAVVRALLDCSLREIFLTGSIWFALLLFMGILLMLLSQRDQKPLTPKG